MQILQYLDHSERRARQHTLLHLVVVEKADVLIHVEDVLMRQTFDIFLDVHNLLQVLILAVVEDRVVHNDAVYSVVVVRSDNRFFNVVFAYCSKTVFESTTNASTSLIAHCPSTVILILTCLSRPVRIRLRSRILIRKNPKKMRLAAQFIETVLDLAEQTFGDAASEDGLAGGRGILGHVYVDRVLACYLIINHACCDGAECCFIFGAESFAELIGLNICVVGLLGMTLGGNFPFDGGPDYPEVHLSDSFFISRALDPAWQNPSMRATRMHRH